MSPSHRPSVSGALRSDGWEPWRRKACVALLARVRARIVAPSSHTDAWARDASGNEVSPRDPKAVSWCVNGAIFSEALGNLESHIDAFTAIQEQIDPADEPTSSVSQVNDGPSGHRRIIRAIEAAIDHLRAPPKQVVMGPRTAGPLPLDNTRHRSSTPSSEGS